MYLREVRYVLRDIHKRREKCVFVCVCVCVCVCDKRESRVKEVRDM